MPESDLRDKLLDPRNDSLEHLRDEGLVATVPLDERDRGVVLTERGRELLELHRRDRDDERGGFEDANELTTLTCTFGGNSVGDSIFPPPEPQTRPHFRVDVGRDRCVRCRRSIETTTGWLRPCACWS